MSEQETGTLFWCDQWETSVGKQKVEPLDKRNKFEAQRRAKIRWSYQLTAISHLSIVN